MINQYFLAFFLATALVGCGGSGEDLSSSFNADGTGGGSGGPSNQSAEGLWSGDIVSSSEKKMPSIGVILSSTQYYFASGDNYTSLIVGSGETNGSNFQSRSLFNPDGKLGFKNGTVSGSIVNAKSLVTNFVSSLDSNKKAYGTLTYDPTFNTQPNLSSLHNTNFLFSGLVTNLQVASDMASFSFLDGDCDYSGVIKVDSNIRNYFLLTMNIKSRSGQTCLKYTDTSDPIVGVAIYTKLASTDHLFFIGINSKQDRWFVAPFKQMPS
jgi:hypothetical protein